MDVNTIPKFVKILVNQPGVLVDTKNYLFILSHMRSYSSLLSHILGSHPDISGYAEMHLSYSGWVDLTRLRFKTFFLNGEQLGGKYVLDKILHNVHPIHERILSQPNVRTLIILRNAEDTLKSIINMGKNLDNADHEGWYVDYQKVSDYYIDRLQQLEQTALQLGRRSLFLAAERIIDDTDAVLAALTHHLELSHPLSSNYSQFSHTAIPGKGDTSDRIKQGTIVKQPNTKSEILLPEAIALRAQKAYQHCREVLLEQCTQL